MPCAFEGEAMEIAFNPQFFIEGIESVETEELVLRLTSPLRPGTAAAGGLRGLLLPRDADPPDGLRSGAPGAGDPAVEPLVVPQPRGRSRSSSGRG